MKIAIVRSLVAAGLLAIGLSACNSTTLETAWKAPEVGSIKFSKILIIAISPVDSLRRPIEEAIKAEIKTIPSVASYEYVPKIEDQVDPKKIDDVIKKSGADGIITMRMLALEDKVTYHEGQMVPTGYTSFYGYYSPGYALAPYYRGYPGAYYGAPMAYEYEPPHTTTDKIMSIETNIYDARDGKLIWTGMTRSKNPSDSDNIIADIAAVIRAKLREQRLVP